MARRECRGLRSENRRKNRPPSGTGDMRMSPKRSFSEQDRLECDSVAPHRLPAAAGRDAHRRRRQRIKKVMIRRSVAIP